jgi:hypothetical protein
MTTQVKAVIEAVQSVLGEGFVSGADIKGYITKEQRSAVVDLVCEGLANGTVDLSIEAAAKYDSPAKLRAYTSGMVTNHFNKCKELNGGVKHEIKNAGIRSGSEQFKQAVAMKTQMLSDGLEIAEALNAFIEANRPVKATTATKKELDVSALPEELQALVG